MYTDLCAKVCAEQLKNVTAINRDMESTRSAPRLIVRVLSRETEAGGKNRAVL